MNEQEFCSGRQRPLTVFIGVSFLVSMLWCADKQVCFAQEKAFSDEIMQVLANKMKMLQGLAGEAALIEAVNIQNRDHQRMTRAEIERLDKHWMAVEETDGLVKSLLTNACAEQLNDFRDLHSEFSEIFVTDIHGLIACTTNKTSDYYQADEGWWQKAYAVGRGKSHHGEIEYDESARAEAIALYVPLMNAYEQRVIGVMKAVCDIKAIMLEL